MTIEEAVRNVLARNPDLQVRYEELGKLARECQELKDQVLNDKESIFLAMQRREVRMPMMQPPGFGD